MNKRGNNEGTIYRRADGRWAASVSLDRGKRKTFYGKRREDVARKLNEALKARQDGLPVLAERQTVGQYLAAWLKTAKPTLRLRTYTDYEGIVRLHLYPALGHIPLAKLAPQDVQRLLEGMSERGLSPRRVQLVRTVLRRALGQALKWGQVARNVAALVDPPRVPRTEVTPMTPEQARAFLAAVQGDRLEALYGVALAVGLRLGEALGLHWQDIDMTTGTLRVRLALQRAGGKLRLDEPKTARARRTVYLPQVAIAVLQAHRSRQEQERLMTGPMWQDTGLVFTSTIGTPLEPRNATRHFKRALERAGLPSFRFHDLRHTAASLMLAMGVGPREIMEILGHSGIGVTMDTYAHVMAPALHQAAGRMDAVLAGAEAR